MVPSGTLAKKFLQFGEYNDSLQRINILIQCKVLPFLRLLCCFYLSLVEMQQLSSTDDDRHLRVGLFSEKDEVKLRHALVYTVKCGSV
jgi:hypothetical protein